MTSYLVVRAADAHRQELLAAADRHRLARDASEARSRFGRRRAGIRVWVKSATQVAMPERSRRVAAPMPSARPMNC
jgi:1,2-phenylacetyl-CoA epoxidase PaaB subunit